MRNSFYNTTNYKQTTNAEKLVLVRAGVLYGLSFETVKQETISYNSGITSIPTIVFMNNNTECFLDFSNQTNKQLESKVNSFFTKIAPLTTFFIHNAFYYDTTSEKKADLSGEYVFNEFFNGIVKATVTSVDTLAADVKRYDKKYFEEIPMIMMNSIVSTENQDVTIIRNIFGINTKNSFNYLGVKVGDFVQFSEADSKYEVLEILTDPNGTESIKIKGKIPSNTLIDVKVLVKVYIRYVGQYTIEPDLNESEVGACVQSQNGVIVSCTDNHTLSQCRFRSNSNDKIDATFSYESFCFTPETDTSVQKSDTDKLIEITNLLARNIATTTTNISNIAGPVNKNGNSKTAFYGRG